jgi:hypothetical protein
MQLKTPGYRFRPLTNSESDLLYDWRFTANQFVLAPSFLWITTREFFFQLNSCGNSPHVTSSPTRLWVCLLWICLAFFRMYVLHIQHVIEYSFSCTVYKFFVSPGFAKQIMSILLILRYNGSLITWTVISLTIAKFNPLIFSFVWLHIVLYRECVHSHDFVGLLLVACTILLYNRIYAGGWKSCSNRGPVCTLENFQWCAKPCFAGATILRGWCLPLVPRRGKHKSWLV